MTDEHRVRKLHGIGTVSKGGAEIAQVSYRLVATEDVKVVRSNGKVTEVPVHSAVTGMLVVAENLLPEGVLTLAMARQRQLQFLVTRREPDQKRYEIQGVGGIYHAEK